MPCYWGGGGGTWESAREGKEREEAGKLWARAFILVSMEMSRHI